MTGRLIYAQEAARASVAQDLHDDVCQQLVFVSMGLSTLKTASGDVRDAAAQEALATIEEDTKKVFEGLRRLSHDLHPATLRLLGLTAALRTHCAEVARHHGVEVVFEADGVPGNVHKDVAVCFFRIAQESLRNGIVHGGARRLSVTLAGSAGSLELTVADDGAGFDVTSVYQRGGGLGLATMSERAHVVGGTLAIESQPARGTTVRVRGPAEPMTAP
jgi:signal transduction histidine kinase